MNWGSKHSPSRRAMRFWEKFPELLFDDPEDEFNDLIGRLRIAAENYFKLEEKKNESA